MSSHLSPPSTGTSRITTREDDRPLNVSVTGTSYGQGRLELHSTAIKIRTSKASEGSQKTRMYCPQILGTRRSDISRNVLCRPTGVHSSVGMKASACLTYGYSTRAVRQTKIPVNINLQGRRIFRDNESGPCSSRHTQKNQAPFSSGARTTAWRARKPEQPSVKVRHPRRLSTPRR